MNYTVEKLEKNQVKFTFTLTPEEWEKDLQQAYQKNKHKYSFQGFRKGKVPRNVLENAYGKGLFFEDAFNDSFSGYYGEALDKEPEVFPVARPDVDITDISDKGVEFVAITTVKPEVTLGKYTGISYKRPEYIVTEADVEDELAKSQEKLARQVEITDRSVQNGDTVTLDYSGSVDGEKFEGGTAEGQTLVIGSGSFIPGFEEQMIGMNIGDEKDLTVKFPEEYHAKELAGKDAVFAVKVHEIKEKQLPTLDDDFAKDVSEFDTLDEFKKDTRAKLTEAKKKHAETESENELVEKVVAGAVVDIPDVMVESEIDEMVQEMEYRFMYQGLKMEDYLKYTGTDMAKLRESYKENALRNVKSRLVIDKIVREEKIEATAEETDAKIKEMADGAKKDFAEYKGGMQERQIDYIKNTVVMEKLFLFLKENNQAE